MQSKKFKFSFTPKYLKTTTKTSVEIQLLSSLNYSLYHLKKKEDEV